MRRLLGPAVLVMVALAALLWLRPHTQPAPTVTSTTSPAGSAPTLPAPDTPSARPAGSGISSAPATPIRPPSLHGRALAAAWLTGYLTRSSRNDDRWMAAIADFSTPELVQQLKHAGPDAVGLHQLSSWHVVRVVPFELVNRPLDTESRTVLAYAAVVSDGTHTAEKPFELYAYRQDDGRWLVSMIEQPYSSEN